MIFLMQTVVVHIKSYNSNTVELKNKRKEKNYGRSTDRFGTA